MEINALLDCYTVDRLRGKAYIGNLEEITKPIVYENLVF